MKKKHKRQPTREDNIFKNYPGEPKPDWVDIAAFFWRACKVYLTKKPYQQLSISHNIIEEFTKTSRQAIEKKENRIWWLGHATFLIYLNGFFIITDPVFENLSSLFPRLFNSNKLTDVLPAIDIALVSHNHYDHLDKKSIQSLLKKNKNLSLLVPEGDGTLCKNWGAQNVQELSWWDTANPSNKTNEQPTITFVPAKHWSRRSLFDCNKSLWGGWVIQHQTTIIYFAGDTAVGDHFQEIKENFDPITYALLPVGPCEPQHENRSTHIDPIQAAEAFQALEATTMIPCHWGTYPLGTDHPNAPIDLLLHWWSNQKDSPQKNCAWLLPGLSVPLEHTPNPTKSPSLQKEHKKQNVI